MCFLLSVFALLLNFPGLPQPPENVFKNVNSPYNEMNPVISPDGKTIYFTIANHPENVGGKRDPGDIWYSEWNGNMWSAPIHGGRAINDHAFNAVANVSADGKTMYLLSHYDASGARAKTQGIAIAQKIGNAWSQPRNIIIPYFQNKSGITCGALSADESAFVYSAEGYGTHGVEDIYITIQQNGKWSEPINLGESINTSFQELSPSFSADGKTLYFSSNGRQGNGSFDVFSCTRLDESWTSWSQPVNMGPEVNSDGRELFYRDYETLGYAVVTTTKDSDGYGDIRMSSMRPPVEQQVDSVLVVKAPEKLQHDVVAQSTMTVSTEDNALLIKLFGKTVNTKTGNSVPSKITIKVMDSDSSWAVKSSDGNYIASVLPTGVYLLKVESEGYISNLQKIDASKISSTEQEINFALHPLEVGTTVNLKNVLFVQTKTELLPESFDELDLVVSFLKENPKVNIELSGHTDNRGVASDNIKLSQERVNAVKKYLVSKGIDGKRITGKGYGGNRPLYPNDSEENRQKNRRVEFTIKRF